MTPEMRNALTRETPLRFVSLMSRHSPHPFVKKEKDSMTSKLVRSLSLFSLSAWLIAYASVFETVDRGGDAAGAVDELGAAEVIDGDHWSVAK